MSEPKRHHYLPEMYLKGFSSDEKFVAVYDIEEKRCYKPSIKDIAVVKELYTIINDKKEKNRSAEQFFNDHIESPAGAAIKKLNQQVSISDEEKLHVAFFIGFIANRLPSKRKVIEELVLGYANAIIKQKFGTLEDTVASLRSRNADADLEEARQLYNFASSSKYHIKPNNAEFIKALITLGVELSKNIYSMSWTAYCAPEGKSFITTDNPFVFASEAKALREGEKFNSCPNARCVFPLSRFVILEMRQTEKQSPLEYHVITPESVRDYNMALSGLATRLIIGQHVDLVKSVGRRVNINPHKDFGVNSKGEIKQNDSLRKHIDNLKL